MATKRFGNSSTSAEIVLGLRFSGGQKRLRVQSTATGSTLKSAIKKELELSEDFKICKDERGKPGAEITLRASSSVTSMGLKKGDVLNIVPLKGTRFVDLSNESSSMSTAQSSASLSSTASSDTPMEVDYPVNKIVEDKVDSILHKKDGRIERKKGASRECQCTSIAQRCLYCAPLEPYDSAYLKENGIKHMSFHSYLKKLSGGVDKGKFAAFDDISLRIKPGCTNGCKPWPEGICSKCQPSALTLNPQPYRHVDNVVFENADMVDKFLAYWRTTGNQRVGFLYGRYEEHTEVPLGIKARVVAIYEPPQESTRDTVKLVEDENEQRVDEVNAQLGLRKVGWIFTDLIGDGKGNVKHYRNIDTHFLSAQECIMAGYFQTKNPNACKNSPSGYFGSKFVTVLVTGNKENQIHMEGYQVSNQCMAMVRDECLVPTKDAPELGYARESSTDKYVPDIFYKEKDKYGNEVTKLARPLPVEYLLLDVPASTPKSPEFFFGCLDKLNSFPIENRPMEGHLQDISALRSYRQQFDSTLPAGVTLANFFKDFHLLVFLATQTVSPLFEHMKPLLEAIRDAKDDAVLAWFTSEHWQTLELILQYS